jgi:NAD(P)-dependent dehydrogenase (short-subunit alcohol dehydrogenase family)
MQHMGRFKGRIALITGGGSGIGMACAKQLAQEGAVICVADVDADRAKVVSGLIQAEGGSALAVACDVADSDSCRKAVDQAAAQLGPIDTLITCAGIHGGGNTVVDTDPDTFDKVLAIDLRGAYLISKYCIPCMTIARRGAIVHVASIFGVRGCDHGPSFHAAKGGLVNLTRHMAIAHAKENIRVNCVCPGVVRTPLVEEWLRNPAELEQARNWHPMGRVADVGEVAAPIAFLVSDEASFITGAILPIDGGFCAAGRA